MSGTESQPTATGGTPPQQIVAVLGAGSWGTALAHHLARAGHQVTLWGRDAAALRAIEETHRNPRYFGEIELCDAIKVRSDLAAALTDASMVVFAVPSSAMPQVARDAAGVLTGHPVLVSTAKGLEAETNRRLSLVLGSVLPAASGIAVLSGPSFAKEVVKRVPTAVTIAAEDEPTLEAAARAFHFDNLRIYRSTDVIGVELGGVVKNVIALAVGLLDGADVGANARAGLITRGLAEMQRLIVGYGGQPMTVVGLSGLGDLLLTATGDLSRNRQVGLRLGRGDKLEDVLRELGQVAEAVGTTTKVQQLAREAGISTPIIDEVARVLSGEHTVSAAIAALFKRAPAREF